METLTVAIEDIYVPVKRRRTLNEKTMETIAESIIEEGLRTPIRVRRDEERGRFVLVNGLHRLEALKALGETTVPAVVGGARQR